MPFLQFTEHIIIFLKIFSQFSMSIKVHLYRKYLYRIKQLCCPRKSCKIIFKNTNCLFHYGNHFRMEVPNMFSQRFNLLCYIEWSQVWDFSSKYDFPLWSALEENDRKTQSNMWIKFFFFSFFSQVGIFLKHKLM